jgi:hypothetical protein
MYIDRKRIVEKLENHKKLLSMISDKILPIKQTLIDDVKQIRDIVEIASRKGNNGNSNKPTSNI